MQGSDWLRLCCRLRDARWGLKISDAARDESLAGQGSASFEFWLLRTCDDSDSGPATRPCPHLVEVEVPGSELACFGKELPLVEATPISMPEGSHSLQWRWSRQFQI